MTIDKVVKELEMEMKASIGYSAERVSAFSRAIEIVKHGGSSDDVCEWKYSGNVYIGCNYKRFTDLHSFEYCPYCGKKIKVVE